MKWLARIVCEVAVCSRLLMSNLLLPVSLVAERSHFLIRAFFGAISFEAIDAVFR